MGAMGNYSRLFARKNNGRRRQIVMKIEMLRRPVGIVVNGDIEMMTIKEFKKKFLISARTSTRMWS